MSNKHHLANLEQRAIKLAAQRREILTSQSETALDMILEAPSPATLVQSFPDQDLYFLMHKIGGEDFLPILAMATSAQWEYILDVEVWDDDRLDIHTMTQAFDLLFQADPKRLLRWIIKEKPDYFEFYLFKNMTIFIREHDEWIPEDFDDYITLDDKFYFRFPHKIDPDTPTDGSEEDGSEEDESRKMDKVIAQTAPELIENMMRSLAEMDLSVFHGLLLETCSVLTAETEEEQFRLKNIRLAEKGFLPSHEAIGIYQPTDVAALRTRPEKTQSSATFDPDFPMPPQLFTQFLEGDNLFVRCLTLLDPDFMLPLQSEIAALSNKIISADRIKIKNPDDIKKVIQKATAYLSLGVEIIINGKPTLEAARDTLLKYFLEDIFRTGSRAGIQLKSRARSWYETSFIQKKNLPLSFLTEEYLGVIGGLLLDRPMFYDNYQQGELYRHFTGLADINTTDTRLNQILHLDKILGQLPLDMDSFTYGVLTYKSLILTLWARNRLGLDQGSECSLNPIEPKVFKPFFEALFASDTPGKIDDLKAQDLTFWVSEILDSSEKNNQKNLPEPFLTVLSNLMAEIGEEYGSVAPGQMDPRFIPHFLLAPDPLKKK